jgi:hypothetical protein
VPFKIGGATGSVAYPNGPVRMRRLAFLTGSILGPSAQLLAKVTPVTVQ